MLGVGQFWFRTDGLVVADDFCWFLFCVIFEVGGYWLLVCSLMDLVLGLFSRNLDILYLDVWVKTLWAFCYLIYRIVVLLLVFNVSGPLFVFNFLMVHPFIL